MDFFKTIKINPLDLKVSYFSYKSFPTRNKQLQNYLLTLSKENKNKKKAKVLFETFKVKIYKLR